MSELRFRVQGIRPGDAARNAEAGARETPTPAFPQVRAGSSARMAEEAKRIQGSSPAPVASIALRGQGGRIVRREELTTKVSHGLAGAETALPGENTPATPGEAAMPSLQASLPVANHGGNSALVAAPLQTAAGRLSSMFRSLFHPGDAR